MDHSKNYRHGSEIEVLLQRQQELVTQLRALILPQLHDVDTGSAELAVQLFDDVISCNTSVVSKLFSAGGGAAVEPVDDKSLVRKSSTSSSAASDDDAMDKRLEEHAIPSSSVGRKRRYCVHRDFQHILFPIHRSYMHNNMFTKLTNSMFICDILYILSSICMMKITSNLTNTHDIF